jgi:hypothetical protein
LESFWIQKQRNRTWRKTKRETEKEIRNQYWNRQQKINLSLEIHKESRELEIQMESWKLLKQQVLGRIELQRSYTI